MPGYFSLVQGKKKKIVILAFFEDASFICSDPCKYPLLLNNYIDRTSLTEIKYNFKIRLLLGKIKNFVWCCY